MTNSVTNEQKKVHKEMIEEIVSMSKKDSDVDEIIEEMQDYIEGKFYNNEIDMNVFKTFEHVIINKTPVDIAYYIETFEFGRELRRQAKFDNQERNEK